MFKEGLIVPILFMVLGFSLLVLRDIAKDEKMVFVNLAQHPDQTFSLSEYSLEKLEEKGSLKFKCNDRFLSIKSQDVAKITGTFEFSEDEVINCDRL